MTTNKNNLLQMTTNKNNLLQMTAAGLSVVATGTNAVANYSAGHVEQMTQYVGSHLRVCHHLEFLDNASRATGAYVQLQPNYEYCPMLVGNDSEPVFVYEIVEAIDGLLDYDEIRQEFPNLSFAQINGAISFLRKMAQFNTKGVDIDEANSQAELSDPDFMKQLRQAFADKETHRVLHQD